MENIFNCCLNNMTIIEIGTGRGGTTRDLVKILSDYKNCHLITTDIADDHFDELKKEFSSSGVKVDFLKTDGSKLTGIKNDSADFIVCNYTLCAIASRAGRETLAIKRFYEVLKKGGKLLLEEEYPVTHVENERQQIWSSKWGILKSTLNLMGNLPFNEINPETLTDLLKLMGFKDIHLEKGNSSFIGDHCLDFFSMRLQRNLKEINQAEYSNALNKISSKLIEKASKAGGMEVLYYSISALK